MMLRRPPPKRRRPRLALVLAVVLPPLALVLRGYRLTGLVTGLLAVSVWQGSQSYPELWPLGLLLWTLLAITAVLLAAPQE